MPRFTSLFMASVGALAALAVLPPPLQAQTLQEHTLYTWDGGAGTTAWEDADNWDQGDVPAPHDALHNIEISTAVTVVHTGPLTLNFNPYSPESVRSRQVMALLLSNGGNLSVTGNMAVRSLPNVARNVSIESGSELDVSERLQVGSANTFRVNNWTIHGTVTANAFQGLVPSSEGGGYTVLLDGGELNITTTFNRKNQSFEGTPTGNFTLSNHGKMIIGEMSPDWTDYSGFYVNFADATGSLTFGKTNWETLESVEDLIRDNHIPKDVAQAFQIADNGTSWTVSILPGPATAR